jgi:hypothetical protein
MVSRDDRVHFPRDGILVERLVRKVEVEPPGAVITDRSARHAGRNDRTEHMEHRVHAHEPVPPGPVDRRDNRLPIE